LPRRADGGRPAGAVPATGGASLPPPDAAAFGRAFAAAVTERSGRQTRRHGSAANLCAACSAAVAQSAGRQARSAAKRGAACSASSTAGVTRSDCAGAAGPARAGSPSAGLPVRSAAIRPGRAPAAAVIPERAERPQPRRWRLALARPAGSGGDRRERGRSCRGTRRARQRRDRRRRAP
jgi:hypothetical protein